MGSEGCDNESDFGFWVLGLVLTHFNSMVLQAQLSSTMAMVATNYLSLSNFSGG